MKNLKVISFHPAIEGDVQNNMNLDFGQGFEQQVYDFFQSLPDLRKFQKIGMIGQGVAAICSLPLIEMTAGLPTIILTSFGRDAKVVGELDLGDYRHNVVRPLRDSRPTGEAFDGHTVLNGGHPMVPAQIEQLATKLNVSTENIRIVDVNMGQIDTSNPTTGVVEKLLATGLTVSDWESGKVLYNPAGFGTAAVVQATAIYGLSGVWPTTIRLNRGADGFFVDEVIDVQSLRRVGSNLRTELDKVGAPISVPAELLDKAISALSGVDSALAEQLRQLK